jgi:polysaccharide pyruvyl transferase WcaK-like protein
MSYETMQEMGIHIRNTLLTADPAIGMQPAPEQAIREYYLRQNLDPNGQYIGFALRNWKGFSDYGIFSEAAAYAWEKYGLTALFYPVEQPADVACAKKAQSLCRTPAYVLEGCTDPALTIGLLSRLQLCVSMRLHGLIFSAAAGIPFIGASYDPKVTGFMQYMGSDACRDLKDLEVSWLCAQIDAIMADREGNRKLCAHMQQLARRNPETAAKLMNKECPLK